MTSAPKRTEASSAPAPADSPRIAVWDLPIRLFHWAMVGCVIISWWTAEQGELDWHRYSGVVLLGLLVFRVYWGFAGSSTARFASFVRSPRTVLRYVRSMRDRSAPRHIGHNPLAGMGALSLLLCLGAQIGFGLFAVDVDGLESGPLSHWVSFELGRQLAELHEGTFQILLFLIGLHLSALAFYLIYRRDNLIGAMWTGSRRIGPLPEGQPLPVLRQSLWRILPGALLAAALSLWIANGLRF